MTESIKERQAQGSRCLGCGVPFCQAGMVFHGRRLGCPLHNLIPEWNDMLRRGNPEHALSRLLKSCCGMDKSVLDGLHTGDELHAARCSQEMANHGLGGVNLHLSCMVP